MVFFLFSTNNHDVLLFTTRSESIRLGTQCLHAIRKCVVENLLKKTMHRSIKHQYHNNDLSLTTSNNSYNTLFQNCISQIHLPSPVKKAILRNFVNWYLMLGRQKKKEMEIKVIVLWWYVYVCCLHELICSVFIFSLLCYPCFVLVTNWNNYFF